MAIVLIEDEPWLGELYIDLLQKAGFVVELYRDIYDALDYINDNPPQAIVLDMILPWSNGIQLLHELASYEDLRTIPIIIYSNALPKELTIEGLRSYGVTALLDKSTVMPQKLVVIVREALHADAAD